MQVEKSERSCARSGCTNAVRSPNPKAMYCGDACRIAAHKERQVNRGGAWLSPVFPSASLEVESRARAAAAAGDIRARDGYSVVVERDGTQDAIVWAWFPSGETAVAIVAGLDWSAGLPGILRVVDPASGEAVHEQRIGQHGQMAEAK